MIGADRPATQAARAAAQVLHRRTGVPGYEAALVLGSGWRPVADLLGTTRAAVAYADLPAFAPPRAPGHLGQARSVEVAGRPVLVLLGRTHLYDDATPSALVHAVRTAVAAGARVVLLTNAAGGINPAYAVGDLVLVRDHLNLTGRSPLSGPAFLDLTDLYSARLRRLAREVEPALAEGVYAGLPGPHFETPAEVAMLRLLGADLVGMSTVLEAIAARAGGAEVLGLSLVTNAAAGTGPGALDAADVQTVGASAAERLAALLAGVLRRL